MNIDRQHNVTIIGTPMFTIGKGHVDFRTSDSIMWRARGTVYECQRLHSRLHHGKRVELFRGDLDRKAVYFHEIYPEYFEIAASQIYCGFVDGLS